MGSAVIPVSRKKLETISGSVLSALARSEQALREQGWPCDLYLKKLFRTEHKFGSRDRHFITQALFAYYRWYGWLKKVFPSDTPPERLLAGAFAAEGVLPLTAEIWCGTNGFDYVSYQKNFELASPEERLLAFSGYEGDLTDRDLIPPELLTLLAAGAEEHFIPALRTRPPVWIRIQKQEDRVLREFTGEGITWKKDSRLPGAYSLTSHAGINLCLLSSYRDGCFELQDFSSQCIGHAAQAQAPQAWWDACAGAGGKTLLLASCLGNAGSVTASDVREKKIEELLERAQRGHFRNIRTCSFEEGLKGTYDGVFADVPCSSSGRWRRNPEMRLTATETWIRGLADLQLEILEKVSKTVRQGGILIYGTCSVFQCENESVIQRFLERNPDFEPDSFLYDGKLYSHLQTFPDEADCDGSFRARFRRKSGV